MIIFALAAMAAAQPTAAKPTPADGLGPLAFLVGHCWRGEFTARKQVDTHCYEPVFDGKHIRDRHEVTGGKQVYRGETIFSWNADAGRVEYVYWNSLGGVSRGSMVPKEGMLDFGDESHLLPNGKTMTISTFWRLAGADAYESVSRQGGVTGDRVVTYQRVK